MVQLTVKFLHLFLLLVAIGSFDGVPWMGGLNHGVAAAPAKARIGIVLKGTENKTSLRRDSAFEGYMMTERDNTGSFSVTLELFDRRDPSLHPQMVCPSLALSPPFLITPS